MTLLLDAHGLAKSHGGRVLFQDARFSLERGESVGVVGRNGSGKSTLLRILAGGEAPDQGTVSFKKGTTVALLPQEPILDPARSVFETVGEGRADLQSLLDRYQRVAEELSGTDDPEALESLLARQANLAARIDERDGWSWSHRVEEILTRLGIDGWRRPVEHLSGGERRRVSLARALLSDPDLLLLDEPTNHLDAETVLWLEETLYDFPGASVVVTHDRYFLDRVVDRMVEVGDAGLIEFQGGYTEYLEARTRREALADEEDRKRRRALEQELEWARRSPPARTGKQKARRERAREMARDQEARDRKRQGEVRLEVGEGPRLGRKVLELDHVTKGYEDQVLIGSLSDRLLTGERIGVVGPNGSGKTTLLRLIIGEEEPDSGEVILGETTRIGYFDQARELDETLTVERAVSERDWVEVGGESVHLRAYLNRFLFPPHVQKQKVSALSGGEKNRLLLARLFLHDFNLLVLDEPTNDLDLDTLQVLEDTLQSFRGCLVVVSHDRYLLDKLATSLWVFEGNGRIHRHHGGWDAYLARRSEVLEKERAEEREEEARKREARRGRAQARRDRKEESRPARLSYREQRELESTEERIETLEAEKEELEERMADPELYKKDPDEASRTARRYEELQGELEALFERWLELGERSR